MSIDTQATQENQTMKITESQLRSIIRQEVRTLREASRLDKLKAQTSKRISRRSSAMSEQEALAQQIMSDMDAGLSAADAVDSLESATFSSDGRGGGDSMTASIIDVVLSMDSTKGQQLQKAYDSMLSRYEDQSERY
jgi:hypothetical protein